VSQMKKMFGFLVVLSLALNAVAAESESAATSADIKARIAPVGTSCMQGDECAAAPAPAAAAEPKSGKFVFEGYCTACHSAGMMGAPKFGSADEWSPRAAKGVDTLYGHALNGFNAMPAKGMCAGCSDDEIRSAVDYMLENSK
jgi:cytochrome c5